MKHALHILSLTLAAALCALLLLALWLCNFDHEQIGVLCALTLGFPFLWVAVAAVGALALLARHYLPAALCLVALLSTYPEAARCLCLIPDQQDEQPLQSDIQLLTYNTAGTSEMRGMSRQEAADSLTKLLTAVDADIVCLQEMPHDYTIDAVYPPAFRTWQNSYPHCLVQARPWQSRMMILSRLPLRQVTQQQALGTDTAGLYYLGCTLIADVETPNGPFRLFCCHLASIRLTSDEISAVRLDKVPAGRQHAWQITLDKLGDAYHRRGPEVKALAKAIERSPLPVIVCGDFNDPPVSHTYNTLANLQPRGDKGAALTDAHQFEQPGFDRSYRGQLPPLRIDNVLTSKSITTNGYHLIDAACSDHKALTCRLNIRPH